MPELKREPPPSNTLQSRGCALALGGIGGQGGGMISMKHSATTLKSPGAVCIYLPKC